MVQHDAAREAAPDPLAPPRLVLSAASASFSMRPAAARRLARNCGSTLMGMTR